MNRSMEIAFADISVIITMMNESMRKKISKKFIDFIENNKSQEYVSNINPQIPIKSQKIDYETKIIMSLIYRDFLCDSNTRTQLVENEKQELAEFEAKLNDIYSYDNLFKKKERFYNISWGG